MTRKKKLLVSFGNLAQKKYATKTNENSHVLQYTLQPISFSKAHILSDDKNVKVFFFFAAWCLVDFN